VPGGSGETKPGFSALCPAVADGRLGSTPGEDALRSGRSTGRGA